jgi:hypothetical protein
VLTGARSDRNDVHLESEVGTILPGLGLPEALGLTVVLARTHAVRFF